jgi:hypothetical protein
MFLFFFPTLSRGAQEPYSLQLWGTSRRDQSPMCTNILGRNFGHPSVPSTFPSRLPRLLPIRPTVDTEPKSFLFERDRDPVNSSIDPSSGWLREPSWRLSPSTILSRRERASFVGATMNADRRWGADHVAGSVGGIAGSPRLSRARHDNGQRSACAAELASDPEDGMRIKRCQGRRDSIRCVSSKAGLGLRRQYMNLLISTRLLHHQLR